MSRGRSPINHHQAKISRRGAKTQGESIVIADSLPALFAPLRLWVSFSPAAARPLRLDVVFLAHLLKRCMDPIVHSPPGLVLTAFGMLVRRRMNNRIHTTL